MPETNIVDRPASMNLFFFKGFVFRVGWIEAGGGLHTILTVFKKQSAEQKDFRLLPHSPEAWLQLLTTDICSEMLLPITSGRAG